MATTKIQKASAKKIGSKTAPKKRSWGSTILAMLGLGMILATGVGVYVYFTSPAAMGPNFIDIFRDGEESGGDPRKIPDANILLAGLDASQTIKRTDTIILARVSMKNRSISALSIPRDTRFDIPGHGSDKVNHAYAIGGVELLKATLEKSLGAPIDYHYIVYLEGVRGLMDAVGGLDIDVEKDMRYNDRAQNLHIDLKKGFQHLNGDQVLQYSRFRHDFEGDYGRIRRQQAVIKTFGKKMLTLGNLKNIPRIVDTLRKKEVVDTNVSLSQSLMFARHFDPQFQENLHMLTLHGESANIRGLSYEIPDREEMKYLVGATLAGGFRPENRNVRVEIKNGSRQTKIAETFAKRIGYFGYNVIGYGNADNFDYDRTQVVVQNEKADGRLLAAALDAQLVKSPTPNPAADLAVILGSDQIKPLRSSLD